MFRRLMYHPESDCLFEVLSQEELESLMKTPDGELCVDVTDEDKAEQRWKEENETQNG